MEYNKFFESKTFRGFLIGIGFLIILLIAFRAGMSVGFRKADFSYRWGDNYHQNFAGPKGGFRGGMEGREYADAHGVIGKIMKIENNILAIKGKDGIEKIVNVSPETSINLFREVKPFGDLKVNDMIIVIGAPNSSGQIDAEFIRIMPRIGALNNPNRMPPPMPMNFPSSSQY